MSTREASVLHATLDAYERILHRLRARLMLWAVNGDMVIMNARFITEEGVKGIHVRPGDVVLACEATGTLPLMIERSTATVEPPVFILGSDGQPPPR